MNSLLLVAPMIRIFFFTTLKVLRHLSLSFIFLAVYYQTFSVVVTITIAIVTTAEFYSYTIESLQGFHPEKIGKLWSTVARAMVVLNFILSF